MSTDLLFKDLENNIPRDRFALGQWNRRLSKASGLALESNTRLLQNYLLFCEKTSHAPHPDLLKLLKRRDIRTLSGVAPVTVLTKPFPCPGQCVYCPTEARMPKSYLSNEPAAMRAVMHEFDPYAQVRTRLRSYRANGHDTDKCELIVLGGTWASYPKYYQTWFITRLYEALNDGPDGTNEEVEPKITDYSEKELNERLLRAEKINETANCRAVGLCLETRPDHVTPVEVARLRWLGATRIQIGLQSIYQDVLDLIKRGEQVEDTIKANRLLREAGFKVDMHTMPNLPGTDLARDEDMYRVIFSDPAFKPDQLKIYPTIVNEYAELHQWWKDGRWESYSDKDLLELCINIKAKYIPYYTRINRLIRDIPKESIAAGNDITNLRQYIQAEMEKRGLNCKCIRCREARNKTANLDEAKLFTEQYICAGGLEYFISYENAERTILYAFVRLRIPQDEIDPTLAKLLPDVVGAAHIRELHTYGKLTPIGEHDDGVQHAGFGRRLMAEAEKIVAEHGLKKIAIIAGVGVREYYAKLGYKLENTYMTKILQ
ncbi:MAG: tRNA uridine(34) 5-carboxymethylaminomethyl modification radical SAM/GNAT enzyme Elp3 [Patescibacteria group bacterium]